MFSIVAQMEYAMHLSFSIYFPSKKAHGTSVVRTAVALATLTLAALPHAQIQSATPAVLSGYGTWEPTLQGRA